MADPKTPMSTAEDLAAIDEGLAFAVEDSVDLDALFEALGIAETAAQTASSEGTAGGPETVVTVAGTGEAMAADFSIVLPDVTGAESSDTDGGGVA